MMTPIAHTIKDDFQRSVCCYVSICSSLIYKTVVSGSNPCDGWRMDWSQNNATSILNVGTGGCFALWMSSLKFSCVSIEKYNIPSSGGIGVVISLEVVHCCDNSGTRKIQNRHSNIFMCHTSFILHVLIYD